MNIYFIREKCKHCYIKYKSFVCIASDKEEAKNMFPSDKTNSIFVIYLGMADPTFHKGIISTS